MNVINQCSNVVNISKGTEFNSSRGLCATGQRDEEEKRVFSYFLKDL